MDHPLQVGITGGIGAGKSMVCRIFRQLGVPVYDADSRAKNLMTTDKILISEIQKEFGMLSYHNNGELNREYIIEQTFGNPERLNILNKLVHPRVAIDYKEWVKNNNARYVIKEAALLYESGSFEELDKMIVVTAPESVRIERVLQRDPYRTEEDVRKIILNQMDENEKKRRADYEIINDETVLVIPQVLKLHGIFSKV